MYAEAGFEECWIVNFVDQLVEVLREPRAGRYGSRDELDRSATLRFPDVAIAVRDLLP